MYPKIVIEHFMKQRNIGKIKDPTVIGEALQENGNRAVFYFKIKNGKIIEVKYQVDGCPYAIASASIFSENAVGKDITNFENFSIDFFKSFFDFPPDKSNCILLIVNAINDAFSKLKR